MNCAVKTESIHCLSGSWIFRPPQCSGAHLNTLRRLLLYSDTDVNVVGIYLYPWEAEVEMAVGWVVVGG